MSDLVVSQHIDDLLDSLNASQSRAVLDVPKTADVPSINSFNNLQNFVNNINGSLINVLSLSGYTYTLKLSDLGYYIRKYHTDSHTIIIPSNQNVPFQIGSTFVIRNTSLNSLTISGSNGVTLNYFTDLSANILDQNTSAQIIYIGNNIWDII